MQQELGGKWRVRALLEHGLTCFSECVPGDSEAWILAFADFMIRVENTAAELGGDPTQRSAGGLVFEDADDAGDLFEGQVVEPSGVLKQHVSHACSTDAADIRRAAHGTHGVRNAARDALDVGLVQRAPRAHGGEASYPQGASYSRWCVRGAADSTPAPSRACKREACGSHTTKAKARRSTTGHCARPSDPASMEEPAMEHAAGLA